MEDSAELFLGLENLIDTYPVIVGYSKKKFTELIKMTNNEMEEFCLKSGVSMSVSYTHLTLPTMLPV